MAAQMGRRKVKFKRKEEPKPAPAQSRESDPTISASSINADPSETPSIPKNLMIQETYSIDAKKTYALQDAYVTKAMYHTIAEAQQALIAQELQNQIDKELMEELGKCIERDFYDNQH